MLRPIAIPVLVVFLPLAWPGAGLAQEEKARQTNTFANSPRVWSVEALVELYVKAMTRQYALNEDQEDYTRQLMMRRVKDFLSDHEREVRSLMGEYWEYLGRREIPAAEVAQDWARRGKPLLDLIRKEILDGNMEWREVLNEEQRARHDRDLELMHKQFDQLEYRLERWSKGDVRQTDFTTLVSRDPYKRKREDLWETIVKVFIQDYNLDEGQQQTAYSILRDVRAQAATYRQQHEKEFEELDAQFAEIFRSHKKTDPAEREKAQQKVRELSRRRRALESPINEDLYKQFMARLEQIPTTQQRRVREESLKKQGPARIGRVGTSGTKPAVDTQPSTTRPAVASAPAP